MISPFLRRAHSPDELQGAGIEAAGEYFAVHRYRGTPPGMIGVKWATG